MLALRIDHCLGRLYAATDDPSEGVRLSALLDAALGDPLADALEMRGVAPDELTYVRKLGVTVRADLDSADGTVVASIAEAIAEAIGDATTTGDAVHYHSLAALRADAMLATLAGDERRAWVWTLSGARVGESIGEALSHLLLSEPREIIPLLRLAASRPPLLARLTASLPATVWAAASRMALAAHSVSLGGEELAVIASWPHATTGAGDPGVGADVEAPIASPATTALALRVRRTVAASRIARALPASLSASLCSAIAPLAILDGEPALLVAARSPAVLMRMAASLLHRAVREIAPARPNMWLADAASPLGAAAPHEASATGRTNDVHDDAARRARAAGDVADASRELESIGDVKTADATDAEQSDEPAVDRRMRGRTPHGGLLFLLHIVGDLGIPGEIVNDVRWSGRSLRWVLHRVALEIVNASPADAAVLAFCGLGPQDAPPDRDEPHARPREMERVRRIARQIIDELAERLGESDGAGELTRSVTARPAEVVADPGWIEIRLPIDGVDVAVRRCGLDRNPDYLPWLGAVVRFVYE